MMTPNSQDNSGIVIDPKSGISEEEQQEILAQINNITEKNRLSLSEGEKIRFKAKKSGGVFPVVVNIVAIVLLAGGMVVLSSMQGKTDAQVRTGAKVFNSAERALIEEIRRETLSLLEAKEQEIFQINSKLEEVDSELLTLHSAEIELTAADKANQNRLKALQEEYRSTLAVLQDERSKILEDARAREAVLQAQLESRTRELAVVAEKSAAVIGYARGELERLDREQRQAAAVEAEMGAFFANLNMQVADNRLDEADASIKAMRDFINTPAFQSLRSIQARKDMYIRAINSFETMIDENKKYQAVLNNDSGSGNPLSALQSRIAQLEKDLEEKDKTLEAVSSQGSGIARRLNDLQADKRQLERANTALQTQNTQLERTNGTLQTQNRQLENANGALRTQNTQLTADLEKQNQAAASLQQNLTQTTAQLQQTTRDLQTEKAETARLTQTVSERDTTIRSREATITNRNDVIARVRTEVDLDRDFDEIPPIEIKARITRIQNALRSLQ